MDSISSVTLILIPGQFSKWKYLAMFMVWTTMRFFLHRTKVIYFPSSVGEGQCQQPEMKP